MNRILLSSTTTDECSSDPYGALAEEISHHDSDEAFSHVYYVMIYVASLWFIGKIFQKIGMPALVGEIIMGIIMGPNLLNLVGSHGSEFLIVIGEIALIMLVVEAGIDVDIGMLKLIGPRGLAIAILGSIIPLSMGFAISMVFGESVQASIAIGSCFAPTSMGIALNVLKKAKILNTPTGQLIIAAAILDDVIALIILSELSAMKHPSIKNILLPLIVSPLLILVVGYLAIRFIPKMIKSFMSKIPKEHHESSILGLLFLSTFLLIPGCHFVGSSHLLGAFLSGLMFCTDHTIHHIWNEQIKRILLWMLRIFFSCTIGFAIPIQEFQSTTVITRGLIYCLCAIGKIVTGFFGRPLNRKEFLTIGFSMSAWGEFAFIIATASYEEGTINKESFSAVLLAVLLSVIISPYCLRLTLSHYDKQAQRKMDANIQKYGDSNLHPVYFAINTKARGQWGHQDKILHKIFSLQLEIIDFRSWHAPEYNYTHHKPLTKESFYVQDCNLLLPPTKHLNIQQKHSLKDRVKGIRETLKSELGEKAVVNIKRWLPGVLQREDVLDKKDILFGQKVPKATRRPSYCRRQAFKQAHSIMSSIDWDYQKELQKTETLKDRVHSNTFGQSHSNDNNKLNINNINNNNINITDLNDLPLVPCPMKETQSVPAAISTTLGPKVPHFKKLQLIRQLSTPDILHSGAGHGGQAKGAGALPVTNKMINIHDHLQENEGGYSPSSETQHSDDSTSYIYGDEDAEHHQLPEYQSPSRRNSINEKTHFHHYIQKPMPIKEINEDSHELETTKSHNTEHTDHTDHTDDNLNGHHHDIEIVTTDLNHHQNMNMNMNMNMDDDSTDSHNTPSRDNHNHNNNDNEPGNHPLTVTVTSLDDDNHNNNNNGSFPTQKDLHGTYTDSQISIKSVSPDQTPEHSPDQ